MSRQAAFALTTTPAARSTDPESSHRTAESFTSSGRRGNQQHRVRELVKQYPGKSSKELADAAVRQNAFPADRARFILGRRLPELVPIHLYSVQPDDRGDCVWYAVEQGRAPRPGERKYIGNGRWGEVRPYASRKPRKEGA